MLDIMDAVAVPAGSDWRFVSRKLGYFRHPMHFKSVPIISNQYTTRLIDQLTVSTS